MKSRPGVTLLEVLTAIFIMGIGLLALLTLFPLGASKMTQAMKDARCVECVNNARANAAALELRQDKGVLPNFPGVFLSFGGSGAAALPADWNGVSYPVYVDAIGLNYIGSTPATLGGAIPRVSFTAAVSDLNGPASGALRWSSLWDDYGYDSNGNTSVQGIGVERESRYSWAYMMRRPNFQNPSVVDVSVVVYAGRNLQVPGGESAPLPVSYSLSSPKTLTMTYVGDKPNLKKGGWILDVTTHNANTANESLMAHQFGPVHGYFYRVVDFTEIDAGTIELELQNVPNALQFAAATQNNGPYLGQIVILDNVAEVFPIGTGRP